MRRRLRGTRLLVGLLLISLIFGLQIPSLMAASPESLEARLQGVAVTISEVDLTWTVAGTGATTAVIQRDGTEIGRVDAGALQFVDTGVAPAQTYSYAVTLVDAAGTQVAAPAPITLRTPAEPETPDTTPPGLVETLSVTPTNEGLLLDWYDSVDDSEVTAYRIYRDDALIATVNGSTLNYLDRGADPSVGHRYAVEAIDPVGNRSKPVNVESSPFDPDTSPAVPPLDATSAYAESTAPEIPGPEASYAPELRRYPYLTDLVEGHVTINWATDRSRMGGSAKWGEVAADGSCDPTNTVEATREPITVNGVGQYQWKAMLTLEPGKQYCYRVYLRSTDLLGSDRSPRFWTQVPTGSSEPFSFVVFGDWGYTDNTGTNPHQANLMQEIADSGARFAITTGDNAYQSGSQKNYGDLLQTGLATSAVFGPKFWTIPGRSIPIFPVLGNHDFLSSARLLPMLVNFPQDRAAELSGGSYERTGEFPNAWYAFNVGNARFYVLMTAWAGPEMTNDDMYRLDYENHWRPGSAEYEWLRNDLAAHPNELKFAFVHFPFYSDNSAQISDTYLQGPNSLEGLLASHGVDITFAGHAHIYQRNHPQVGELVTYVTGGGGARLAAMNHCREYNAYGLGWSYIKDEGSSCNAQVPQTPTHVYHFLLVKVDGNTVTVTPTDQHGHTFDEVTYTINAEGVLEPAA